MRPSLSALAPRSAAPRAANATLVGREDLTPVLARFRVTPDDGPVTFVAGQYATLSLADASAPPRPYSIASRPGARDLDFVISLVPDGSLTPRLFELGVGSRVHVGPARGLFRLDADEQRITSSSAREAASPRCWPCSPSFVRGVTRPGRSCSTVRGSGPSSPARPRSRNRIRPGSRIGRPCPGRMPPTRGVDGLATWASISRPSSWPGK